MVPWNIVTSAESLLNFMSSLGIFLSPIIAVSIADYWIVKRRRVDVPALYRPKGRYAYYHGCNWRAVLALLCSIGPAFPSLINNINSNIDIGGAKYIADLVWYYGFLSAFVVYIALSKIFPAHATLISRDEFVGTEVIVEETIMEKPDKEEIEK
jgi:NCS1 family nucleobase:cation symporter-1